MKELRRKRTIQRLLYSWITITLLALIVLFAASAVWGVYQKYRESRLNRIHAEEELTHLKERQQNIKEDIRRLGTEKGVEQEIREKFGLSKEGEKVIVIVDPEQQRQNKSQRAAVGGDFFDVIWRAFKSIFQ